MEGTYKVRLKPCEENGRWGRRLKWTSDLETWKLGTWVEGVLDLHKSGNELSLDLHKSGNEFSLDLHKSGNELSLDLHINKSPKWNSSLLDF